MGVRGVCALVCCESILKRVLMRSLFSIVLSVMVSGEASECRGFICSVLHDKLLRVRMKKRLPKIKPNLLPW